MTPYTFRGKTQSLPAWSRELGIPENTLRSRLVKINQSVEEAFARPVDKRFQPAKRPVRTGSDPPRSSPATRTGGRASAGRRAGGGGSATSASSGRRRRTPPMRCSVPSGIPTTADLHRCTRRW